MVTTVLHYHSFTISYKLGIVF